MLAQVLPVVLYIPHAIKRAVGPSDLPWRVLMPLDLWTCSRLFTTRHTNRRDGGTEATDVGLSE